MEISLTKEANKMLQKIKDYNSLDRIKNGIDGLRKLEGDIKKLKGFKNQYRLRIGDYRIIFFIENNELIIITMILPRGSVYKNL